MKRPPLTPLGGSSGSLSVTSAVTAPAVHREISIDRHNVLEMRKFFLSQTLHPEYALLRAYGISYGSKVQRLTTLKAARCQPKPKKRAK